VTDGRNPAGSLIYDGTFLYGMTEIGGTNNMGTLFKIMPNGSGYVKLLDFAGATNGRTPLGSLNSDGTFLYGMTNYGGINDLGVLFKIMPGGTGYSKLLDFTGANGSEPYGSLIFDGTFLYGMTEFGGANNVGVLFKIMPDGTGYSDLLDFAGAANGKWPLGSLISDGTFLYGMTGYGGTNDLGTIFKLGSVFTGTAEKNADMDFNIFPNPSTCIFNIDCAQEIKMIAVNDIIGKEIYKSESSLKTIDGSNFLQGVYFITVKTAKGIVVKKIIKE
ncbi:MAG: choice-of-anchor tandem repeat GloVer-containing protein, partial [Candidatus Paceibacterales bacterium]